MSHVETLEYCAISRDDNRRALWENHLSPLVSLFKMQQFAARHFVKIMGVLARIETLTDMVSMNVEQFQGQFVQQVDEIEGYLHDLQVACAPLELAVTVRYVEDLHGRLRKFDTGACGAALRELRRLIECELETKTFLYIPQEKLRFFNDSRQLFGERTLDRFPSVIAEVEEAGKCYAAGRNTASVFHLLRVLESGLRAVARSLSITTDTNRSWNSLLKKITMASQTQHPHDDRTAFYAELVARLYAVKDAWRNPTMHIERRYGSEEARDIFNSVASCMHHISTRLREVDSSP